MLVGLLHGLRVSEMLARRPLKKRSAYPLLELLKKLKLAATRENYVAIDRWEPNPYRNDGNGRSTDVSFVSGTAVSADGGEMAGMGVAVCDFNHGGRFSINITNFEDQGQSLYRNHGGLNFTEVSNAARIGTASVRYLGWGIGCVDLDNDGWHDLFAVNGHVYPQVDALQTGAKYRQRKLIFLNQRDGTFRDVSALVGPALGVLQPSRGAAFGDLDNDGRIDVVVENIDGRPMVLHNDATSSTRWITLELVGTRSNRLAIGAKVKAAVGSLVQMDEVRSGGSYLSQSDLRIHFGLDNAEKVERVEIRWPSGQTEVLQNLPANRFYVIKEGEGIAPPERARPALKKAAQKNMPRSLAYKSPPEKEIGSSEARAASALSTSVEVYCYGCCAGS